MSTIIYALEHHWDEGGSTIRGLYFSEEEALKDLPVEVVEYLGSSPVFVEDYPGDRCVTYQHDDLCCAVEAYTVAERAIGAVALPKPEPVPFTLFPEATARALREYMTHYMPNVYRRSADATTQDHAEG
jgi:hypothetical protein